MSDKMREEFEAWAKENYFDTDKILSFTGKSLDEGRYDNSSTQTAWQAWQASRAALVVKLPVVVDIYDEHFGDHYEYFEVDDIKKSLDVAGVKYNEQH